MLVLSTKGMRLRSFTANEKLKIIKEAEETGNISTASRVDPGGLGAIILASGFEVSIPAGGDGFFQSVKILSMTSFGREVKPWVPCRRFTTHKRTSSRNLSL